VGAALLAARSGPVGRLRAALNARASARLAIGRVRSQSGRVVTHLDEPLVSVITPTYNRATYLREAVQSVFDQTYANWELIVVDDGSTDGTHVDLRAMKDDRLHIVALEHCGNPAQLRNAGLERARGEYVAFLDSDDRWFPEKLARQVAHLRAAPRCGWSYTYFEWIGPNGEPVPSPPGTGSDPWSGWILEGLVTGRACVATPTVLAQRTLMSQIGGFDESLSLCEDYDAFIRMSLQREVALLAAPLCAVRMHPGNTWKGRPPTEVVGCQVRVYEKLLAHPIQGQLRKVCELQYALAQMRLAACHRARSEYRRAFGSLWKAFPRPPTLPAWWVALVKTCVRPFMPPVAMRVYRSLRRRL